MSLYPLLVFLHVLCAIGIFVALGIEGVWLGRLRAAPAPVDGPAHLPKPRRRLGPIAMIGAIAAGMLLMRHGWGRQPWILSAAVGLVGMMAIAGLSSARWVRSAAGLAASLRLRIALAIGIVALMSIKPGAIGAWTVLIASALSGLIAADLVTGTRARARVVQSAVALLLLTSVHHAYGAHVYQTPWRYHVLLLSIPAMLVILWAHRRLRRHPGDAWGRSILILVTLVVPVLAIGAFEGFYNHLLKDVLYFRGASPALLNALFPRPTYEMPNDAFFEITGVAQALLGAATAWTLYRFAAGSRRPTIRRGGAARIAPGALLGPRQVTAISGEAVRIPDPDRLVHLQFRRFAGCPVCNLHLQSFARRHDQIQAAGIREVVVFHSSTEDLRAQAGHLPFSMVADPEKRLYAEFGVESAPRALLDPRAWGAILLGVARSLLAVVRGRERLPPVRPRGGSLGLPADFLIDRGGRVIASKYGQHADDQWSVDEVLRLASATEAGLARTAQFMRHESGTV